MMMESSGCVVIIGAAVYRNGEVLQSEDWPGLIDTHCHLDLEPLSTRLEEVISRAHRAGVTQFVVPGVHPHGWERMTALAQKHAEIFPAFGIHPMHAAEADDDRLSQLAERADSAVAIGEIGLDPAYAVSLERQEEAFREQLRLAVSVGLPVLVHCRKAFQRTLRILQEEHAHQVGGIMHAFSGSPEMARDFIRLGFAISICGMITRESAVRPLRIVRELPLESLVLETDAPDLAPQRYRGQFNQPAYIVETLRAVAGIKGLEPLDVARSSRLVALNILRKMQGT
jgi:TatD DNase family protein